MSVVFNLTCYFILLNIGFHIGLQNIVAECVETVNRHHILFLCHLFAQQENPNAQACVQKVPRPTEGAHLRVHQPLFPLIDPERVEEIIKEGMTQQQSSTTK